MGVTDVGYAWEKSLTFPVCLPSVFLPLQHLTPLIYGNLFVQVVFKRTLRIHMRGQQVLQSRAA